MLTGDSLGLYFGAVCWGLSIWLIVGAWRLRRRRVRPGAALLDAMELFHAERQRAAIEQIHEQTTGYKDPEDKESDPPPLTPAAG